jgi:hypothetical protein
MAITSQPLLRSPRGGHSEAKRCEAYDDHRRLVGPLISLHQHVREPDPKPVHGCATSRLSRRPIGTTSSKLEKSARATPMTAPRRDFQTALANIPLSLGCRENREPRCHPRPLGIRPVPGWGDSFGVEMAKHRARGTSPRANEKLMVLSDRYAEPHDQGRWRTLSPAASRAVDFCFHRHWDPAAGL